MIRLQCFDIAGIWTVYTERTDFIDCLYRNYKIIDFYHYFNKHHDNNKWRITSKITANWRLCWFSFFNLYLITKHFTITEIYCQELLIHDSSYIRSLPVITAYFEFCFFLGFKRRWHKKIQQYFTDFSCIAWKFNWKFHYLLIWKDLVNASKDG